jgi:hypothetical protein
MAKPMTLLAAFIMALVCNQSHCGLDRWGPITKLEFPSENGKYLLRIEPHDDWPNKPGHCRGTLYHIDAGVRTEVWSRFLINNHAPVNVYVANSGSYVVTMDEWHNVGELPVVVYGNRGRLVRVHSTDSLGLENDILHIKQTVSSYWWNEDAITFFGPDDETLCIQLHWGKLLMLDLHDGEVMNENWLKSHKGWAISEAKWDSLQDFAKRKLAEHAAATPKLAP